MVLDLTFEALFMEKSSCLLELQLDCLTTGNNRVNIELKSFKNI